jgi:hypothetical protein
VKPDTLESKMLEVLGDFPVAVIDPEARYWRVSPGWAKAYSPGHGPEWWKDRDHIKTFKLDENPDWLGVYLAARKGSPFLHVDALDLPGLPKQESCAWALSPIGGGWVAIFVLPVVTLFRAVAASVEAPDA